MAIPKVIHYCWFGRNPKPKLAEKCIKSWKKFCPDYEIIEWNEDNLHAVILKAAEELEKKSGAVYTVLRIAISACTVTPGGCTELADILGKEESMRRLKQALAWLNE